MIQVNYLVEELAKKIKRVVAPKPKENLQEIVVQTL